MQSIPTRKEIEHIAPYVAGKPIEEVQRELKLAHVIKLASNENPYGCSPAAKAAMQREIDSTSLYPEAMGPELLRKLAGFLQVSADKLILGSGSDELIRLLTRAYVSAGDEVIMADVTFPRYETNVGIEGGKPVIVPLIDGTHDLDGMYQAISAKTKLIFVCNPNNPTGTIVGRESLKSFIARVPQHIMLVIDEAYCEYVEDEDYLQTIPLLDKHPNLVILRTFSKIYGLAALRIGYGIMQPQVVSALTKVKDAFNTSRMAQAAALAALDDTAFVDECRRKNSEGRHYLEAELAKMQLAVFPSHANFLMVKFAKYSGEEIFNELLKQGIIVRSGHLLGYPDTIRVSIGTIEQNKAFLTALQHIFTTIPR